MRKTFSCKHDNQFRRILCSIYISFTNGLIAPFARMTTCSFGISLSVKSMHVCTQSFASGRTWVLGKDEFVCMSLHLSMMSTKSSYVSLALTLCMLSVHVLLAWVHSKLRPGCDWTKRSFSYSFFSICMFSRFLHVSKKRSSSLAPYVQVMRFLVCLSFTSPRFVCSLELEWVSHLHTPNMM